MKFSLNKLKLLLLIFSVLIFTGCNLAFFLAEEKTPSSLTLSKTNVSINDAVALKSSFELAATVTGSTAKINWYTNAPSVVALSSSSGNSITVTALNSGTATVSAVSDDGELYAACTVVVSLGSVYCHEISDFKNTEVSTDSASFSWTLSEDAVYVRIDCYKDSVLESSSYFLASELCGTVKNLFQNTQYSFVAYGCNNAQTEKETLSKATAELSVTTVRDTTSPSSVKNITYTATDHSITFEWENPSDVDFAFVNLSTSSLDMNGSEIPAQKISAETTTAVFENLSAQTEFTFSFASEDKFGNVQSDENNSENLPAEITALTLADSTAPAALENIFFVLAENSLQIVWDETAALESSDFDSVKIQINQDEEISVEKGNGTYTAQITNGSETSLTLYAQDISGNKSSSYSAEIDTSLPSQTVNSLTAQAGYTGQIKAEWTGIDEASSYVICAENESDGTVKYSDEFSASSGFVNLLEAGKVYKVKVCPVSSSSDYKMLYANSTESVSVTVQKLVWSIIQPWGSQEMVPQITEDETYANVIITSSSSSYLYAYWIVWPAVDGSDGFSLEAADSSYAESGLYLYFGENASGSVNYNSGNNTWGYSASSHAHLSWTASLESIGDDTAFASFTVSDSYAYTGSSVDGYGSWFNINLNGDTTSYLYSNNYNVSADTGLESSYASQGTPGYDWSFACKEISITE